MIMIIYIAQIQYEFSDVHAELDVCVCVFYLNIWITFIFAPRALGSSRELS